MAFKRGRALAFTVATVLATSLVASPAMAEETTVNLSMFCSSKADKQSAVASKDGFWNYDGQEIEATFKVDAPATAELGSVFDYTLKPVNVRVKNKKWVVDDTWYSWGYSVEFLNTNFGRYRINIPEGVVATPETVAAGDGVKATVGQDGRFVIVGGEHTTDSAAVPAQGPSEQAGQVSSNLDNNALALFPEVNLKLQASALGQVKPTLPLNKYADTTAHAEKSFYTTRALWSYTTRGKTEQAPVHLRCVVNNGDLPAVTIVPKTAQAVVKSVSLNAIPNPALAGQEVQVTGQVTWEGEAPATGSSAKIIVDGQEHSVVVSQEGRFTYSFTPDKAGTVSLKATSGEQESEAIELTVNPDRSVRTLQLEATPQRITEGETVTVNVKALDRENNPAEVESITINDGTTDHTVAKTGEAFTLTLTPKKTTTIQATSGTVRSNTQRITVDPRPAQPIAIDVKATPAEVTVGQSVKLSAEVTYDDGAPKPLPSVVFSIDGKEIEVNRQPGTNLYRTTFITNTPGTYPYSVKATEELNAQGVLVVKNRVAATIAPAITVQEKQAQISFTVTDATSKPVAGQPLTVNVGHNNQEVVTNAHGVATLAVQREENDQSVHAQIGELLSEAVVVPAVHKAPDLSTPTGVALKVDPVIAEPGQDVKVTAMLTYGDGFIQEPATLRLLVGDQEITATQTGQLYTYEAVVKAPQSGVHKVRVEVAENVFAEARIVVKAGEGEDQLGVPAKVDVDVDKHNDNYRVTATVTDASGDVVPNHTVTFTIGEAQKQATTDYEGKATITVAPAKEATTVIAQAGDITAQPVEIPAQPQSNGLWWKILLGVAGVGALIAALVGLAKQFGLDRYLPKF